MLYETDFFQAIHKTAVYSVRSKKEIPNEILNDCSLWQVSNLVIEYSCQDKDKIFATEKVNYDEDWLLKNVQKCEEYWMGNRFAQGY